MYSRQLWAGHSQSSTSSARTCTPPRWHSAAPTRCQATCSRVPNYRHTTTVTQSGQQGVLQRVPWQRSGMQECGRQGTVMCSEGLLRPRALDGGKEREGKGRRNDTGRRVMIPAPSHGVLDAFVDGLGETGPPLRSHPACQFNTQSHQHH